MDNCLVTIFISQDIVNCLKSNHSSDVGNPASMLLYGYHKKGECSRGEKTVPQHMMVITGSQETGADTSTRSCTCPSLYQQLGEITSTITSAQPHPLSNTIPLQTPCPKSCEREVWVHLNTSVVGVLSSVVIDQRRVDLESVSLIFYSPYDICQSDLLSLKYPYNSTAGVSDTQPVCFCIAKVRKQFQSRFQSNQTSMYILYKFLESTAFIYEKLLSLPNLGMGLQSPLDWLFGYKSATLDQVSLRINQLKEIQRLLLISLDWYSRIVDTSNLPESSLQDTNLRITRTAPGQLKSNLALSGEAHALPNTSPSCGDAPNTESADSHGTNVCFSCSRSSGNSLRTSYEKSTDGKNTNSSACLVLGRLVCVVVADLALGAFLLHWLLSVISVDGLFTTFGETTQGVSDGVLRLLSWLRGAPAGLKLNQPLARALATFFSYHVGLWMLYLEVASGAVYGLCWGLVWSGVLGASVQVALLADMLHLATLHLHCIYVYAARLHMVQVSLFGSQWRAFRGHKWNPLKQRVDSLHPPPPVVLSTPDTDQPETCQQGASHGYNTRQTSKDRDEIRGDAQQSSARSARVRTASTAKNRQRRGREAAVSAAAGSPSALSSSAVQPEDAMVTSKPLSRVLSAVIFTLVVFLLPTTTVFYLVFVSLRLVLYLVNKALSGLAWLLHHNPLYLVLLTICRSSKLKGDLYFERLHQEGAERLSGPLLLALTVRPSGLLTSLRQYAASDVLPTLVAPDMGHLLQTVLYARNLL